MATLYIHRATPFKRGAQNVDILVDGQKACTLWNVDKKAIEVAAGLHTLQASMSGFEGPVISISAKEGEIRTIDLITGEFQPQRPGLFIAFIMLSVMPDRLLSGNFFWIKVAAFAMLIAYFIYMLQKSKKGRMLLIDQGIIQAESDIPQESPI